MKHVAEATVWIIFILACLTYCTRQEWSKFAEVKHGQVAD